jgi:DNA-binding phage protein
MEGYLRRATELQNDAIRCNNRTKHIIAELSERIQRNRDLTEVLRTRDPVQRLFDALSGRGRSIRSEMRQNTAQINAYLAEALQEINERSRINAEALAFVNRVSTELREITEEYAGASRADSEQ